MIKSKNKPDNYLEDIKNMNYEEVYKYIQKNKGSKMIVIIKN